MNLQFIGSMNLWTIKQKLNIDMKVPSNNFKRRKPHLLPKVENGPMKKLL